MIADSERLRRIASFVLILLALTLPVFESRSSETAGTAAEPDYSVWNRLLAAYYNPVHGMNYGALKAHDSGALRELRRTLARVDPSQLTPREQLAYWINLYNIGMVGVVVDHYPVKSVLDISGNRLIRHDVFKRPRVDALGGKLSLNDIENEKIRAAFRDARIHFAINCAAKSCPPIRPEAYTGDRVDAQLDDQIRRFAAGPGVRVEMRGTRAVLYTSRVMQWFNDDFDEWAGGEESFLRRYLPPGKAASLTKASRVTINYDDYDWALNDWRP